VSFPSVKERKAMPNRSSPLAAGALFLAIAGCAPHDGRPSSPTDTEVQTVTEAQAIKAIEKFGGKVVRDDNAPDRPVVEVDLSYTEFTDAGLKRLAPLKRLQTLKLTRTRVTDAGLKELASLKTLQTLTLAGTQVTDAGLKELAGLKSLRLLFLDSTRVTDAGLRELAELKSLQFLDLAGTQVTDAGVAELRKALPKCKITR
jgi:Leucine-rich repeat (LRR) protein